MKLTILFPKSWSRLNVAETAQCLLCLGSRKHGMSTDGDAEADEMFVA